MQGHRLAAVAFAAALLAADAAVAADIRGARYDARTDSVLVEIAYRGTHPKHDFRVQWDPCADGAAVGRLVDRQGGDAAKEQFIVQERISLEAMPCSRPAAVTLRLGRSSLAQVHVPRREAAAGASAPSDASSMARLQDAAQRLREAIQALARQPTVDARNEAIDVASQALLETQQAMNALPPELHAGASAGSNPAKAMERLQQAAERLRDAVQDMSQQPPGEPRKQAAAQAREALLETQQAMSHLP